MTDNEKLIQSINRHLKNMTTQQLRTMLIVAMELDSGNDREKSTN